MKKLIFTLFIFISLTEINATNKSIENNEIQLKGFETFGKIEDKILNVLEEIKNRMCHGIPKFAFPILDPFKFEELQINLIENFEIALNNGVVEGLSNILLNNLKANILLIKFTGKIELDDLNIITNYTAKGTIPGLFDIDGEGQLNLDIGFSIDIGIRIITSAETKNISILIEKLEPKLKIHKFRITGLFPDDELNKFVEDLVKDLGVELIGNAWEENKEVAIELIQMLVSDPLSDLTVKDILELLKSDKPIFDETDPKPDCKDSK